MSAVFLQVLYTDIHLAVQSLLLNCKKVQATLNECCATCVVVKLKMYPGYILICLLQEFLKLIGHPKLRDKLSSSVGGGEGGGALGNTPPGSFERTKLNALTKLQQKENTGI